MDREQHISEERLGDVDAPGDGITPGETATVEHPAVARIWEEMAKLLDAKGEAGVSPGEPVTVYFGDLFAVLALLDSSEVEVRASDQGDDLTCDRCGHSVGVDAYLPNDVWAKVAPGPCGGGALCVWCADAVAAEQGIPFPVPVTFHYEGKVLAAGNPLKRALAVPTWRA